MIAAIIAVAFAAAVLAVLGVICIKAPDVWFNKAQTAE